MSKKQQNQPYKSPVLEHKRVLIQSSHGENLVGILHETGSEELVIICHRFRCSKDWIPVPSLAFAFEKEGITAFQFDFAGDRESEGSFQYGNYTREVEDTRAVVEHFRREQLFVTAVIGHSKGGNVILLYASRYNDVPTILNLAGPFDSRNRIEGRFGEDFKERLEQDGFFDVKNRRVVESFVRHVRDFVGKIEFRVVKEGMMDHLQTDTRAACRAIPPSCRVLTVHGAMDQYIPVEDATKIAENIANHTLCIVEGADHEFTKHQPELATIVLNFVKIDLNKPIVVDSRL